MRGLTPRPEYRTGELDLPTAPRTNRMVHGPWFASVSKSTLGDCSTREAHAERGPPAWRSFVIHDERTDEASGGPGPANRQVCHRSRCRSPCSGDPRGPISSQEMATESARDLLRPRARCTDEANTIRRSSRSMQHQGSLSRRESNPTRAHRRGWYDTGHAERGPSWMDIVSHPRRAHGRGLRRSRDGESPGLPSKPVSIAVFQ